MNAQVAPPSAGEEHMFALAQAWLYCHLKCSDGFVLDRFQEVAE